MALVFGPPPLLVLQWPKDEPAIAGVVVAAAAVSGIE